MKASVRIVVYMVVVVMLMTVVTPVFQGEDKVSYAAGSGTYRILEIQPTNNYQKKFGLQNSWRDFISYTLLQYGSYTTLTRMTVDEFIGKEEDLVSNYDIIYIGVKSNGDDDSLGTYTHMGEEATISKVISNKGQTTQKSGVDITADKKEELLQFAQSGGTIIISDYAYVSKGAGNHKLAIDEESNMYDLLHNDFKAKEEGTSTKFKNVISCNLYETLSSHMKSLLTEAITPMEQKCSLSITEKPVHNGYINKDDINNRELKYGFNISDSLGNAERDQYQIELFIDLNSDGKYEESENLSRYMQVKTKIGGKTVNANELKAGTQYILTRDLGDYVGIVYWKLRLTKLEDGAKTAVRDEIIDYCKVQAKILVDGKEEVVKKNLKVLQIMADEGSGQYVGIETGKNNVWLPTQKEMEYLDKAYPALAQHTDPDSQGIPLHQAAVEISQMKSDLFNLYGSIQKIPQDNLVVTLRFWIYTRNLDEFKLNIERIPVPAFQKKVKEGALNVNDYDMLILGFADCYTDIREETALKAIDGFIKDGKTILFTHDTTSFVTETSYSGTAVAWGYNINKYFRNMLGLDRYGFLSEVYEQNDKEKTEKDYVWNNGGEHGRTDYTARAHGFTDYITDNSTEKYLNHKHSTRVTSINRGQISTYPYEIPDTLDVATTHGQYYQLDMEADDVVVWYSLIGGEENYYGAWNSEQSAYDKDVRNNYYIYNRKNITYSGAGHNRSLSVDEVKLFINTMVGAYRASSTAVSIDITNPEASKDREDNTFFYISYLKDKPKQPIGANLVLSNGKPAKRVSFILRKNAINTNGKMTLKFGDITTFYDESGKVVTDIKEDTAYYVDIPLDQLEGNEKIALDAVLTVIYNDDTGGTTTKVIKTKVTLMRRAMFNLN